jgi:hypothetical protein
MLEGVGVVGVAKKLVSFPIILHPTVMHTEVNVAQSGVHRRQQRLCKHASQRLCACAYSEVQRTDVDEGTLNQCNTRA